MAHVLVRHKVKDYKAWKSVFDGFHGQRQAGGEKSYQILHPDDDPNNLVLLFEWDGLDNARKFMSSAQLKQVMGEAGVTEPPEIHFLEQAAKGTV